MNDVFKIDDKREIHEFKSKTFSGFKKTDVINAVLKAIEAKKIEQACHWTTECIISGYTLVLWEKLLILSSKLVHINNPKIPYYMNMKNQILMNQIKRLNNKSKNAILLLRNSQMVRNLFFDVVTTICTSLKTKKYDKYAKIDEKEDFKYENIQKRLCSKMNILPNHIIQFNDPNELRIIINEIFTLCKNKQFGYERSCFWIIWLTKWEALHRKKKTPWNVSGRVVDGINPKHCANFIWIVWEVIFEELKTRRNNNIKKQINSLYSLYKCNYSPGKRNSRLPLVFNAIGYLTNDVKFTIPLRSDPKISIQVQTNVNKMFSSKKIHEIKPEKIVIKREPEKKKKKLDIEIELVENKIDMFNEIDNIVKKDS